MDNTKQIVVEYKGVTFRRTYEGYWLFDNIPQHVKHLNGHWSCFITPDEHKKLSINSNASEDEKINIMKMAVDRCLANLTIIFQ